MSKFAGYISRQLPAIARHPAFYLIYLIFFFIPWLGRLPSLKEIGLSLLLIGIFIPIHFLSFRVGGQRDITYITLTQLITLMLAPLSGMNGVFHIYAGAQAGYQRGAAFSALVFLILTLVYAASAFYFDRHIIEIIFVCIMAAIIWITCLQDATQIAELEAKERALELEKQQASIIERERIARDLHDLLGHTLTMVSLKSDLAHNLIDTNPKAARQEIDDIRSASRQALSDIRDVLSGMNRTTISEELTNARHSLETAEIDLEVFGHIPELNPAQEQVVALAIREAVTNVIRHSNASKVTLSFARDSHETLIEIEDNGSGPFGVLGQGLEGLRKRVSLIGGRTDFEFDAGARIALTLPHQLGQL